jgi:ABC-2 type transport system ATP-binding protein
METLIEATNITKKFGQLTAAKNVSIALNKGDVLGFLGPNGAGKTTTMRMIAGYLRPDEGFVKIAGIDMWQNPLSAKKNVGYLPEGAPLYPEMTPLQLLRFAGKLHKINKIMLSDRIEFLVNNLGLNAVLTKPIDTLSKGFKRRVGIALAILHDPKVLILDEPTDGLDPLQKQDVRELIKAMAAEKAIIISTHILEEVDNVCNKCAIIASGQVVYNGTTKQLRDEHAEENIEKIFCQMLQKNMKTD